MRRFLGARPLGVWIALLAMVVCLVMGVGGQALSLLNWDLAVRLGLQENRTDDANLLERVLAHMEWGTCAADIVAVLPLWLLGFVGVACRRHWGAVAAMMAAACWVYAFFDYSLDRYSLTVRGGLAEWERFSGMVRGFALMGLVPAALVIWGLGANVDRFAVSRPPAGDGSSESGR